jgi:putative transposase
MNSPQFCDVAPRQIWATRLDSGIYDASWRTMYRILAQSGEVRERRNQLRHPEYEKPELLASRPNQLWSWDITKLRGPGKWAYYYLYVIMDVFSRYVVGWMIAESENATLASELIEVTCGRQGVDRAELTIHADRGSAMTSKTVAQLLVDLGVEKSHSRPHISNDNPYSEAQFKTMKYRPEYPARFGSIMDARNWMREFFAWYNEEHHHSGIGLMPPRVVHYGEGEQLRAQRALVLEAAYAAHPERFVRGKPTAPALPEAVWINKPVETDQNESRAHESEVVIQQKSVRMSGDGMPEEAEIPLLTTYINQQMLDEAADPKARA